MASSPEPDQSQRGSRLFQNAEGPNLDDEDSTPLEDLSSTNLYLLVQQHDSQTEAVKTNDPEAVPPRVMRNRSEKFKLALVDIALFALPLLFLVLATSAVKLDGMEESQYGQAMMSLSALGPTIFPIAFTDIIARLMKAVAYFLAEGGTRLVVIEQLVQIQSLASSVEAAVSLRRLTAGGTVIVSAWLLSLLGGQSSLRVLKLGTQVSQEHRVVHYLGLTSPKFDSAVSDDEGLDSIVMSIFMASVIVAVYLGIPRRSDNLGSSSSSRITVQLVDIP
ncbi:hypothetical protein ACJZ2D_000326 [Fusarium nematophilum]